MEYATIDHSVLHALQARIQGDVLMPGDEGYDAASRPWDLTLVQKPALVVRAANRDDVVEAVRFAKQQRLQISVINTGHGVAEPANGALLLNVSRLRGVRVDESSQSAWMEAGAIWRDVLVPAQEAGLAPPMGSSTGIGAVGFTLLGGIGWLSRKFGLALDMVRSFELVTADGDILVANAGEHPDLFWALRGAGAAFGVVTAMEISLLPVRSVYAGSLVYPPEMIEEVLVRYREWVAISAERVGDSLSSGVLIGNFPVLDSLPPYLRGRSAVVVRGCLIGSAAQGTELLRFWRDWRPPLADQFSEMPFTDVDRIGQDPREPLPTYVSNITLRSFPNEVIQALARHSLAKGKPGILSFTDLRETGGAIARMPAGETSFSQRDSAFILTMVAVARNNVNADTFTQTVDQLKSEIPEQVRGGVYLNFLNGPDKWILTPDAFTPEAYRRLTGIKYRYDPENRFSFSLDIPPLESECCEV